MQRLQGRELACSANRDARSAQIGEEKALWEAELNDWTHERDPYSLDVIAEGIESEQEAQLMRNYKTTFGQGFYFSRPVNETEFVKLLRQPQIKLTG